MNSREFTARKHKAEAIAAILRKAGLVGTSGVALAKTMMEDQWKLAAIAAGVKMPSEQTRQMVYKIMEDTSKAVTITTTLNHLTYTISVVRAGELLSTITCAPHEVVNKRNKLCAYWSNHASDVTANGVPPIVTLREKRSA
jgi:hypothetical protein